MASYSTAQVAEILGIGTDTLHRWLKQKRVVAPDLLLVGGVKVRGFRACVRTVTFVRARL